MRGSGSSGLKKMPFSVLLLLVLGHGPKRTKDGVFWVAQRARHNATHALAIGRGLSRPIDISRLLQRAPSAADEIEIVRSTRSNPARRFFARRMKWRSTGGIY